jgi:hypothetical protein
MAININISKDIIYICFLFSTFSFKILHKIIYSLYKLQIYNSMLFYLRLARARLFILVRLQLITNIFFNVNNNYSILYYRCLIITIRICKVEIYTPENDVRSGFKMTDLKSYDPSSKIQNQMFNNN